MLYFGLPFTERPHSYCYLDRSHVHCIISFPFSHFKYLDRYKSKPAKYCRQFIPNHNYCYTVSISLDFYTREPAHTPLTTLMSFDPRLPDCSLWSNLSWMSREWPRTLICCSFFMLFLLLFFSRWSHTCVDFGDADKFSCILKANVVTGSQITDGYITNKKKQKINWQHLTLYRWQKFWNKKSHSKSETKVKLSTSWLIIM